MQKTVSGTISKTIWTPFGNHTISIPVTVILQCDENGVPQSVLDVQLATGSPIL